MFPDAKQVADAITGGRLLIGLALAGLGLARGAAGLPTAAWLMLVDWTADNLDGVIARRQRPFYHTWLGDNDLVVDMLVATGLLVFLVTAGFAPPLLAFAYVMAWATVFWRMGVPRSLGMLVQAPIYAWFIWAAVRDAPDSGRWLLIWLVAAIIVTWPRFPREVIPGFLTGLRGLTRR